MAGDFLIAIDRSDYEFPSAFYRGRDCDPRGNLEDSFTLYPSCDLVTDGVVLGKTGLCLFLLERVAKLKAMLGSGYLIQGVEVDWRQGGCRRPPAAMTRDRLGDAIGLL